MLKIIYLIAVQITLQKIALCDLEYAYNIQNSKSNLIKKTDIKFCSTNQDELWYYFKNEVDTNHDSLISAEELYKSVSKQIKKTNELDLAKEIYKLDQNSIGQISFHKYASNTFENFKELESNSLDETFSDIKNIYEIQKKKWEFISTQPSGVLSHSEFYSFIYSEEFPNVHDYENKLNLELYDLDHNSYLSVDEFIQAIRNIDETMVHPKTLHFSPLLDLDGNNLLNSSEFKSWYSPSIDLKIATDLKPFNLSSDSYLNRSIILSNCELLLQSQITDFGMVFFKNTLNKKDEL